MTQNELYELLENMSLKEQIGQGYEITEEMNTKLAEAFK